MIRVTAPLAPGFTRTVRSMAWAEERARRLAVLTGASEIQRRDGRREDWETIVRWVKVGSSAVRRAP